jgi:uncharacterized protein YbaP (TraB family)
MNMNMNTSNIKPLNPLKILLIIVAVTLAGTVQAATSVWQISNGEQHLYIGGTVHVLNAQDYPLPIEFDKAYAQADTLVLETDMQKLESAEFQQLMLRELSYPKGQDLKQVLTAETYQTLSEYCAARGIGMQVVNNFKPSMVTLMLTMVELKRLNFSGTGVDKYYSLKAIADGKKQGQLETAEAQLAFIAAMGQGKEDALIRYSLQDMQDLPHFMNAMKAAWRKGDTAKLKHIALEPMLQEFPDLYQSLLVQRNNHWLPQIESMLTTKDTELILVGALHLVGKDGLLERLKASGYAVTQY